MPVGHRLAAVLDEEDSGGRLGCPAALVSASDLQRFGSGAVSASALRDGCFVQPGAASARQGVRTKSAHVRDMVLELQYTRLVTMPSTGVGMMADTAVQMVPNRAAVCAT